MNEYRLMWRDQLLIFVKEYNLLDAMIIKHTAAAVWSTLIGLSYFLLLWFRFMESEKYHQFPIVYVNLQAYKIPEI